MPKIPKLIDENEYYRRLLLLRHKRNNKIDAAMEDFEREKQDIWDAYECDVYYLNLLLGVK